MDLEERIKENGLRQTLNEDFEKWGKYNGFAKHYWLDKFFDAQKYINLCQDNYEAAVVASRNLEQLYQSWRSYKKWK